MSKTNRDTLFHHENTKQKRSSKIVVNHSSDIEFKDFMKLYKDYTILILE